VKPKGAMALEKTFILGLGCQKGGTTWLYKYLSASGNADFGELKEYHVWNALDPENDEARERYLMVGRVKLRNRILSKIRKILGIRRKGPVVRYELQRQEDNYFNYFSKLLRADVSVTGDITPNYSSLSVDTLRKIRSRFLERGIRTRAVFLMRDPVERAISAACMLRRMKLVIGGHDLSALPLEDAIWAYAQTSHSCFTGRYDQSVERFDAVFESDEIYYGFYETMFSEENVQSISDFCGVEPRPDFVNQSFNSAPEKADISSETRARLRVHFSNVYAYCHQKFPETRQIWN